MKRLYKSNNRIISGVCAGIAEYYGWDVSLVRLAWVFATLVTGFAPFVILYIVAAIILPESNIIDNPNRHR